MAGLCIKWPTESILLFSVGNKCVCVCVCVVQQARIDFHISHFHLIVTQICVRELRMNDKSFIYKKFKRVEGGIKLFIGKGSLNEEQ